MGIDLGRNDGFLVRIALMLILHMPSPVILARK